MRYNRDLTQKELGILILAQSNIISRIESGRVKSPSINLICKIATALRCTVNDFIKL